jgi:hypothetical protein
MSRAMAVLHGVIAKDGGLVCDSKPLGVLAAERSTTYPIPVRLDRASCSSFDTLPAKTSATNTRDITPASP